MICISSLTASSLSTCVFLFFKCLNKVTVNFCCNLQADVDQYSSLGRPVKCSNDVCNSTTFTPLSDNSRSLMTLVSRAQMFGYMVGLL